jgi:protein phosphatase
MRITAYAKTDVGRTRQGNEDSYFEGTTVFAVADGMGGHQAGEVASEMALRPIAALDGREFDEPREATDALREAIESANSTVSDEARTNPDHAGMGTTLTAVLVRDGRLHLAHVGDSRAYLLRGDEDIDQHTTDHTLVEQLVQEGRLSRDEISTHPQRSVITRAIGVDADVEVDTLAPLVLQPGDQVLLCSDGLTGPVDDTAIAGILTSVADGDEAVKQLIDEANANGGPDNITVVLLRAGDGHGGAAGDGQGGEAATAAIAAVEPPRPNISIRTRPPESEGHDWARDFSRYGDRNVGEDSERRGWVKRILALVTGLVILAAVLAVGGWLVLSRAFFLGDLDGNVAIFNGLPEEVAGVELYRLREETDVPVDSLSPMTQQRVREGLTVASMSEAEAVVARYRNDAEAAETGADATEDPGPDESATP